MRLKDYQDKVLTDLRAFLAQFHPDRSIAAAFREHWKAKDAPGMKSYVDTLPGVPHVCVKVPTGGGKTYLAAYALRPIFDWRDTDGRVRPAVAVWLAPSRTIVDQTLRALRNPAHPYRRAINQHFQGRVEVYDKDAVLQGAGFSADGLRQQLSILVLSYDSLKTRTKDNRKLHEENGTLQTFVGAPDVDMGEKAAPSVIDVVRAMAPVVIVDESHNATTSLSRDMLLDLAPSFVLDLTATPRDNANIISFVDALALKTERMVKLPVIVHNRPDKESIYTEAIDLQARLERAALAEEEATGRYIRPIVLFQAESRTGRDDRETFERVRERLQGYGIPADHIKIKTGDIDEIKGLDLLSRNCDVRFIITVNALKEGWDCPFAYVLASLADRSSEIDVEQILGRVLRQPHTVEHGNALLNMSYVLTALTRFDQTVRAVVKGLKSAGFSERDYRIPVDETREDELGVPVGRTLPFAPAKSSAPEAPPSAGVSMVEEGGSADDWLVQAAAEGAHYNEQARTAMAGGHRAPEEEAAMNRKEMMPTVRERALSLELPQFYLKIGESGLLADLGGEVLLERENLMKGFSLAKCDIHIDFAALDQNLVEVDVEEVKGGSRPRIRALNVQQEKALADLIRGLPPESRIREMTGRLFQLIGSLPPVTDPDIRGYVRRVLETMQPEEMDDCISRPHAFAKRIREKIRALMTGFAKEEFQRGLRRNKIVLKPSFRLPPSISPAETANPYANRLYEEENRINGLEDELIRLRIRAKIDELTGLAVRSGILSGRWGR